MLSTMRPYSTSICFPFWIFYLAVGTVSTFGGQKMKYCVGCEDEFEYDQVIKEHYMTYFNLTQVIYAFPADQTAPRKFCSNKPTGPYSLGICKNFYAHCNENHALTIVVCPAGKVFRPEDEDCVDQPLEARCFKFLNATDHHLCKERDNEEVVALEECSSTYGICYGGSVYFVDCPGEDEAYSARFGKCIEKRHHPKCDWHDDIITHEDPNDQVPGFMKLVFQPISAMCTEFSAEPYQPYRQFLGPCNKAYMECDPNGYAFFVLCPDKGHVADPNDQYVRGCLPPSSSDGCPEKWSGDGRVIRFVENMNVILKATEYCKNRRNGLYFDPYSDCRREAIFCMDGEGSFHLCPANHGIDAKGWCSKKEICQQASMGFGDAILKSAFLAAFAADAGICPRSDAGAMRIFGLCENFWGYCHEGYFEIQECDSGEVVDVKSLSCKHRSHTSHCQTNGSTPAPNRCASSNSEQAPRYFPHTQCSALYFACINGWEVNLQCERNDYAFNEDAEECIPRVDHPTCPEYSSSGRTTTTDSPTPTTESLTCSYHGEFESHEDDCTKYYVCVHGRLIEMSCPAGTAFEPSISGCNHKNKVDRCDKNKITTTTGGSSANF